MSSTSQVVMPRARLGWRIWAPSAAMMSCGVLAYIDRQALAVLSPTILQDMGLSAEAYATALSAFSFAYMIGNPLWGSFLDFVGLRVGMLLAVTLWTLASVSHAWVGGLLGLSWHARSWASAKAPRFRVASGRRSKRCRAIGRGAAWRFPTAALTRIADHSLHRRAHRVALRMA